MRWILLVALLVFPLTACEYQEEMPASDNRASDEPSTVERVSVVSDRASQLTMSVADLDIDDQIHVPGTVLAPEFSDVHEMAAIKFIYQTGATGEQLMVEAIGGGAGWLDYDLDSFPDLYCVQGGDPVTQSTAVRNQFFRNQGDGTFQDFTAASGLGDAAYGQGLTIADFNNDGFDDIFVTNITHNRLYQNMGDGTFEDISESSGTAQASNWSTSAAWGDLNLDGNLDLYVCNYVKYDVQNPKDCSDSQGVKRTCHPNQMEAEWNEVYFNLGNGRFKAASAERGIRATDGKSLGVVISDLNKDGYPDVYVANDVTPNFLFLNQQRQTFQNAAIEKGCAMSGDGNNQASMGIAHGDYDHNGFLDLYVTHFTDDSNTLYANLGEAGFHDATKSSGLHRPTIPYLAFGTVMGDFNYDRQMDLFVANGHIDRLEDQGYDWKMTPLLFCYQGQQWANCSDQSGPYFKKKLISRGVAAADYDNDGDQDLFVVHQNDPAALLQNQSWGNHWLKILLIGRESNRSALGAKVEVVQPGEVFYQELVGGSSYCSSSQRALFFGLGSDSADCTLKILWPSGRTEIREAVPVDQTLKLIEPTE
ncbi:CRTAC1 family protein [Gimesia panareensis]|uniref:CRTAC1 family protein n=1 Tax=Gimesia panareensis TaxID=2527978 RepID=UPI0018D6296E|nr:CRTAC1 family protein [Gimesia panareensis]